jgi:hypothetical protein
MVVDFTGERTNQRLNAAGFQNDKSTHYDGAPYAYRSDTLLNWLLERGEVRIAKGESGYKVQWLHWYGDHSGIRFDCYARTLSDALADATLKVLASQNK